MTPDFKYLTSNEPTGQIPGFDLELCKNSLSNAGKLVEFKHPYSYSNVTKLSDPWGWWRGARERGQPGVLSPNYFVFIDFRKI